MDSPFGVHHRWIAYLQYLSTSFASSMDGIFKSAPASSKTHRPKGLLLSPEGPAGCQSWEPIS